MKPEIPEDIILLLLDDNLTPEQEEHLKNWLEDDPENKRAFVRAINIDYCLHDHFKSSGALDTMLAESGDETEPVNEQPNRSRRGHKKRNFRTRRTRSNTIRYLVLNLAAVAALVIIVHWYNVKEIRLTRDAVSPVVAELQGDIMLIAKDGERTLRPGERIRPGNVLTTREGEHAVLKYPDGTSLDVQPSTTATFNPGVVEKGTGKLVQLKTGALLADVAPQPKGKPFLMSSEFAMATVVGTRLEWSTDEKISRLSVTKGIVDLRCFLTGITLRVPAGKYAEAGPGITPALHDIEGMGKAIDVTPADTSTDIPFIEDNWILTDNYSESLKKVEKARDNYQCTATLGKTGLIFKGINTEKEWIAAEAKSRKTWDLSRPLRVTVEYEEPEFPKGRGNLAIRLLPSGLGNTSSPQVAVMHGRDLTGKTNFTVTGNNIQTVLYNEIIQKAMTPKPQHTLVMTVDRKKIVVSVDDKKLVDAVHGVKLGPVVIGVDAGLRASKGELKAHVISVKAEELKATRLK
ncbi:MAG: FecR domain-containing protein [Planctomycetes bacterium]|nr:FecR domain-containing protein [Planctomycetota bacterium]